MYKKRLVCKIQYLDIMCITVHIILSGNNETIIFSPIRTTACFEFPANYSYRRDTLLKVIKNSLCSLSRLPRKTPALAITSSTGNKMEI